MKNDEQASATEHGDYRQRRNWTRFPPDKPETWVIIDNERKPARICDESFDGIGVTIETADAGNVQVGNHLIVLHCGYPTPCRVQWIQQNQVTKQSRLGIHWLP